MYLLLSLLPALILQEGSSETTPLNAADPLTYEAEKLFGIDLNGDGVQGRNVQEFDRGEFTTANNIHTFEGLQIIRLF